MNSSRLYEFNEVLHAYVMLTFRKAEVFVSLPEVRGCDVIVTLHMNSSRLYEFNEVLQAHVRLIMS